MAQSKNWEDSLMTLAIVAVLCGMSCDMKGIEKRIDKLEQQNERAMGPND